MKISIIIPSNNEANYVERLINFIEGNTEKSNIEEIIIIESLNTKKIVKVAEKSHAKLYYNAQGTISDQMEIGAFQAKGEIIYFIKPGCIPPTNFDKRIIKYVEDKYAMGCFDMDRFKLKWNLIHKVYSLFAQLFPNDASKTGSLFILKHFAHQTNNFRSYNDISELKQKIILKGYKTLL